MMISRDTIMCKRLWSQADSGMSGLILIEDPADCSVPRHIRRVSCPLHCEHDIQLIFQAQLAYRGFGFSQAQRLIRDNLFMCQSRSYFCLSLSSLLFFLLAVATNSSFFGRIVRYVIGGCFDQGCFPTWRLVVVNLQIRIFASSPLTLLKPHLGSTFTW